MAVLSITSISNNTPYQPTVSIKTDIDSRPNFEKHADSVQLSDYAKNLLVEQKVQSQPNKEAKEDDIGKESVQISSSVGRVSRVTGLQREDVAALYRSIENLT